MLATDAVGGGALPGSLAKAHHHGLPPAPAGHTQHPFPACVACLPWRPTWGSCRDVAPSCLQKRWEVLTSKHTGVTIQLKVEDPRRAAE